MTESPLRILLGAFGTLGEIQPVIGLGATLRARGHEVRVLAPPIYEKNAKALGLDFSPVGSAEKFEQFISQKWLWRSLTAYPLLARGIADMIEPTFEAVAQHHAPRRTVLVHSWMFLGGRVARDALQIPTVTMHPYPVVFRSRLDPVELPPLPLMKGRPGWNGFWYGVTDVVMDQLLGRPVNRLRDRLGLPPVRRIMQDWVHSPDRVIGLFPDWYAPPQDGWPKQAVLTGFPLYDASKEEPLSAGLQKFLGEGTPPVVFSSGTGMRHAARYFSTAIDICRTSGRRGVLLSSFEENFKATLPSFMHSERYAPFSQLLPRSAAFFHHGGIGSVALALAAGTPQIAVPVAYDQPDNGARIERLGTGMSIPPRKFNVASGVAALDRVLGEGYARACADVKARFVGAQTLQQTADWVERTFAERTRSAPSQ